MGAVTFDLTSGSRTITLSRADLSERHLHYGFESRFETADTRETLEVLIVAVNGMRKGFSSRVRDAQAIYEVETCAAVELKCFQHGNLVIETQPATDQHGSETNGDLFSR